MDYQQQRQTPQPQSRTPVWIAVALAAVVLLAAGAVAAWMVLSAQEDQPPAATPTASPPPADGGIFTTPESIIQTAGATLPCSDVEENTEVVGALRQLQCADGNLIIRVYEGIEGVNNAVSFMRFTGGNLLTGRNWTINADPDILQAVQEKLGGRIVNIPCEKPDCALAD